MPSEKRARQRAGREARLAALAQAKKRRTMYRNIGIVGVVILLIVGIAFLVSGNGSPKKKAPLAVATTTTAKGATTTTTAPATTTTAAGATTTTTAPLSNAAAQKAANTIAVKAGCPASTSTTVNTQKYSAAPAMTIDTSKLYSATVVTTAGTFIMALDAKSAPITTNNFVFLANKGYYHCVIFHRVIPGQFDQTGDPTGTGTGGPGYTIPDELPATTPAGTPQYPLYSVAMANAGANTGGSQWFIVAGADGESLAPSYSLFGRVVTGSDVVEKINAEGNSSASSNGTPPDVTERIISVTINEASGS